MIYWGLDETDLFNTLELILERLEEVGLYAAAHKCTFFEISITWCGKVYSQGQVKHDPERLTGLATMRRPETAAELMQFLQAVTWPGDLGRGLDLGVDRGLGGGAGSCRSRCGFVSPEAGMGGAYVSGCLR